MTDISEFNRDFFSFLSNSPTSFHASLNIKNTLLENGFIELSERKRWELEPGHGYFVTRDSGSIISFTIGDSEPLTNGFRLLGGHTDSPCLQLKPSPSKNVNNNISVGVEVYGGPLLATWFDRDLSLAGRVYVKTAGDDILELLTDFSDPVLTIPSLAIHLDREANKNRSINAHKDIPPLLGRYLGDTSFDFNRTLKQQLHSQYPGVEIEEILSFDIFCYDTQKPSFTGINKEFISAGRIDNLLSCFVALKAIENVGFSNNTMLLCYNHEENGSTSISGAQSSFVEAVFDRLLLTNEDKRICFANSFHVSMDNAHATHPNATEKSDSQHQIEMNKGIVLKINANQSYASNAYSSSIFKVLCQQAGVDIQEFVMRSDMISGSTIGSMTAAKLGIQTVDVGAPTLGMHSIREITGSNDVYDLYRVAKEFLTSSIHR